MNGQALRRTGAITALLGIILALAGCLLTAGKFTSTLDIRKDGGFSYAYSGEITLIALSKQAQSAHDAEGNALFKPDPCTAPTQPGQDWKTAPSPKARPCTSDELAEQRKTWELAKTEAETKRKSEADGFKAMLGGIDPSDPRAAQDFADRLRKQAGWRKVIYKGDGLYEVDFAITSRLDRDFAFPTIERFPMGDAFVTISRRQDGTLRIDAPGLSAAADAAAANPMLASLAMAGAKDGMPANQPHPEGRFTLTTDATILSNNTEEGAKPSPNGQRLDWDATAQPTPAPMAVLKLSTTR